MNLEPSMDSREWEERMRERVRILMGLETHRNRLEPKAQTIEDSVGSAVIWFIWKDGEIPEF